jgi:hypothetical protein
LKAHADQLVAVAIIASDGTGNWLYQFAVRLRCLLQLFERVALGTLLVEWVERITAADDSVSWRRGAIAERATDFLSCHHLAGQHVGWQIGIRQDHSTKTN